VGVIKHSWSVSGLYLGIRQENDERLSGHEVPRAAFQRVSRK
jgi:hypothetical protein